MLSSIYQFLFCREVGGRVLRIESKQVSLLTFRIIYNIHLENLFPTFLNFPLENLLSLSQLLQQNSFVLI